MIRKMEPMIPRELAMTDEGRGMPLTNRPRLPQINMELRSLALATARLSIYPP
jgi:hypothetical protein